MSRSAQPSMIQKMLDENTILINTIIEYQQQGRHQETYDYQKQLQRNLTQLAMIADNGSENKISKIVPAPPLPHNFQSGLSKGVGTPGMRTPASGFRGSPGQVSGQK